MPPECQHFENWQRAIFKITPHILEGRNSHFYLVDILNQIPNYFGGSYLSSIQSHIQSSVHQLIVRTGHNIG